MVDYAVEIPSIYSMPLYDADACTAMIDYARRINAWTQAVVSVTDDEQRFISVVNRKTRLASAFTPEADSTIMKEFDARMNDTVKPLVRRLWSVHLTEHTGTHMVRYVPGNYYAAHNDTGLNLLD